MRQRRQDDVMLLGEFARNAGVSRATAYIWARANEIPADLIGGRYALRRRTVPSVLKRLRDEGRIRNAGVSAA